MARLLMLPMIKRLQPDYIWRHWLLLLTFLISFSRWCCHTLYQSDFPFLISPPPIDGWFMITGHDLIWFIIPQWGGSSSSRQVVVKRRRAFYEQSKWWNEEHEKISPKSLESKTSPPSPDSPPLPLPLSGIVHTMYFYHRWMKDLFSFFWNG